MAIIPPRLEGKKVLITGAAQGLGEAIARLFTQHGARVALTDLNVAGVTSLAQDLNAQHGAGTACSFRHDVSSEADWRSVAEAAAGALGGVSVLINNAGVGSGEDLDELSLASWRRVFAVNVESILLGIQWALPLLRAAQPASIVNLSSTAAMVGNAATPAYNASKAAVWNLSKSIALHCARQGWDIRCNSLHPSWANTPILDPIRAALGKNEGEASLARRVPLRRLAEPGEVAAAALFLASDESRYVTGAELKVDGGRLAG